MKHSGQPVSPNNLVLVTKSNRQYYSEEGLLVTSPRISNVYFNVHGGHDAIGSFYCISRRVQRFDANQIQLHQAALPYLDDMHKGRIIHFLGLNHLATLL